MNATQVAEWHKDQAHCWARIAEFEAADKAEPTRTSLFAKARDHSEMAKAVINQKHEIADFIWTYFMDYCLKNKIPPANFPHFELIKMIRERP